MVSRLALAFALALASVPAAAVPVAPGDVVVLQQACCGGSVQSTSPSGVVQEEVLDRDYRGPVRGAAFESAGQLILTGTLPTGEPGTPDEFQSGLFRVDLASGTPTRLTSAVSGAVTTGVGGIAAALGGDVVRVNPVTGAITPLTAGGGAGAIISLTFESSGDLLAVRRDAGISSLLRIDGTTGAVSTLASGGYADFFSDVAVTPTGEIVAVGLLGPPTTSPVPPFLQTYSGAVYAVDAVTGAVTVRFSGGLLEADTLGDGGSFASQVAIGAFGHIYVGGEFCFSQSVCGEPFGRVITIDPTTGAQNTVFTGISVPDLAGAPIPEPATALLVAAGLVWVGARRRSR